MNHTCKDMSLQNRLLVVLRFASLGECLKRSAERRHGASHVATLILRNGQLDLAEHKISIQGD